MRLFIAKHLKVHESCFSFLFLMEKSILYAKITLSQKFFFSKFNFKEECSVFLKKSYYGWKRCIIRIHKDPTSSQSYQWRRLLQNLLQSWDLLCTLDIWKSSHASFPALILLNPNNHYNHGFPNTYDYNHYVYSDYLVSSVPAIAYIIRYWVFVILLQLCK